jgi:hypothetical protein
LNDTDKIWAEHGFAFYTIDLVLTRNPEVNIKIGHGICMNSNPWKFKSDLKFLNLEHSIETKNAN